MTAKMFYYDYLLTKKIPLQQNSLAEGKSIHTPHDDTYNYQIIHRK